MDLEESNTNIENIDKTDVIVRIDGIGYSAYISSLFNYKLYLKMFDVESVFAYSFLTSIDDIKSFIEFPILPKKYWTTEIMAEINVPSCILIEGLREISEKLIAGGNCIPYCQMCKGEICMKKYHVKSYFIVKHQDLPITEYHCEKCSGMKQKKIESEGVCHHEFMDGDPIIMDIYHPGLMPYTDTYTLSQLKFEIEEVEPEQKKRKIEPQFFKCPYCPIDGLRKQQLWLHILSRNGHNGNDCENVLPMDYDPYVYKCMEPACREKCGVFRKGFKGVHDYHTHVKNNHLLWMSLDEQNLLRKMKASEYVKYMEETYPDRKLVPSTKECDANRKKTRVEFYDYKK
jgi:hypothetical protein